jgi:Tfp pilus assembly protein FimT
MRSKKTTSQLHTWRRPARASKGTLHPFSLLEMLLAMGLLAFLMLVLVKFFANMQTAFTLSMNTAELYENARVAFDVITRDLQCGVAAADDIPGRNICFHQSGGGSLWFVTSGEISSSAKCGLIEVGYRWSANRFERAFVDDTNSGWAVYGNRDDADDQDGYRKVIEGVMGQSFVCYSESMVAYSPNQATALPHVVSVMLTLMDSKAFALWQRMPEPQRRALEGKVTRTFRKTVFLGGRGSESL